MVDDEKVTYDDIKQKGIKTSRIIAKREANKITVFLEMDDGTKKQIADNLDTISLFGVRIAPEGGPFFIAIMEEGVLSVYEEILYKIREEKTPVERNMRIYIPIW